MIRPEMLEEAKEAIRSSSQSSSIYVGCDSIRKKKEGRWTAKYSVCVIVHKDSRHGCQIFHDTITLDDFGNLKQRLLTEVGFAVEAALAIIEDVGDRGFEIHLDLNSSPKHKSHVAVKEAIGWVRGSLGIEPHVKPYSFASSIGADHVVRGYLN